MDGSFAALDDERVDLLETEGGLSPADEFLDELMPPEFDWRGVVRRHPIPSLCVAGLVGWWLGRSRRGAALAEAALGAVALGAATRFAEVGSDPFDLDDAEA